MHGVSFRDNIVRFGWDLAPWPLQHGSGILPTSNDVPTIPLAWEEQVTFCSRKVGDSHLSKFSLSKKKKKKKGEREKRREERKKVDNVHTDIVLSYSPSQSLSLCARAHDFSSDCETRYHSGFLFSQSSLSKRTCRWEKLEYNHQKGV